MIVVENRMRKGKKDLYDLFDDRATMGNPRKGRLVYGPSE